MTLTLIFVVLNQTLATPPLVAAESNEVRRPATSTKGFVPLEGTRHEVRAEVQEPGATRRLWEVAVPGAIVAMGSYLASAVLFSENWCLFFCGNRSSPSGWLLIPVLGPWIALADHNSSHGWETATLALGLTQGAGLLAMIFGMSVKVPVGSEAVSMNVVPTGNGMALGGTF